MTAAMMEKASAMFRGDDNAFDDVAAALTWLDGGDADAETATCQVTSGLALLVMGFMEADSADDAGSTDLFGAIRDALRVARAERDRLATLQTTR